MKHTERWQKNDQVAQNAKDWTSPIKLRVTHSVLGILDAYFTLG